MGFSGIRDIIEDFTRDYYDPTDPLARMEYEKNQRKKNFSFGIVTDNQDPDKRGRIRVHLPMIAREYISTWIWIFRPYAGPDRGVWALPDIGDQVMIAFLQGNIHHPVCIGGMYTPRHRPPIAENQDNNIKAVKTKGCYLLMDDTPGEERMEASIKDGKIRIEIDTKGVHLTNELGGININCRNFKSSSKELHLTADKDLRLKTGGNLNLKAKSTLGFSAGGDITIKGSSVDLKGSTGVTAEGKQIARENDPVAGMDLHDIEVPSSKGTNTVPMVPHPYIGKLNDKLSSDVSISGSAAATEGSKSEFGTPGHFPMPPGVKFSSTPDNLGEVTGGCIDSVTINGKPAAVLGSTVTTCDDGGQKDHCTVLAPGTVVTFPIQYPGQDPEQYRRDGGIPVNVSNPAMYTAKDIAYRDQPKKLTALQWSASEVEKGKEVTLSCSTSGVKDGASVIFSIYPDGANTETDPPVMDLRAKNKGSKAEMKWTAKDIRKPDIEHPMKWFFTAWTLYCPKETSGTMEVTRVLPEFSEMKWELVTFNQEGEEESREEVQTIEHGLKATLSAKVKNLEDGKNVRCRIYEEGYAEGDEPVTRQLLEVKDGMVTKDWKVEVSRQRLEELTENDELKFLFVLESMEGVISEDSAVVQAVFAAMITMSHSFDENSNEKISLQSLEDGKYSQSCTISDYLSTDENEKQLLKVKYDQIKPGLEYKLIRKTDSDELIVKENVPFVDLISDL